MKKFLSIIAVVTLSLSILSGCAQKATTTPTPAATKTDTVTSASIVNNSAAFEKAISKNGTWIIAILKDVTTDKDLVLDGEFNNKKKDTKGKLIIQRKIALYAQDAKHVVTARYTLTAPKITINSPNASIEHGIFKGDIYVENNTFQLKDNKVIGNIYFKDAAAKAGFKMDKTSSVTGKQEIQK
jgi:hypothetical protein